MNRLVTKLKLIKSEVKAWEKRQKWKNSEEIFLLEEELKNIYDNLNHSVWNDKERSNLEKLEFKKKELLLLEEESWRHKSRAIWIEKGDSNTIFFINIKSSKKL